MTDLIEINRPNKPDNLSKSVLYPASYEDLERFEHTVKSYLNSEIDEDSFRIFRLNFGIYGQRQGGHNQMVRVKLPGGVVNPEQLDVLANIAEKYSRGWGHITTRQNIQFHFVPLEQAPEMLWELGAVGLTTREACGDTVRNITCCPLAGVCPSEVLNVSLWAQAAFKHFLRHAYAQRLPRKFKINFSGCAVDCGQAMFNDIGVIATQITNANGKIEKGFKIMLAGGLGANPHPAQVLEPFTPREMLLPTMEAILRTFDHYGNRDNKLRARMKWLVDTLGIEQLRERILKERALLFASVTYKDKVPEEIGDNDGVNEQTATTLLEGYSSGLGPTAYGIAGRPQPVNLRSNSEFEKWKMTNVVRSKHGEYISVIVNAKLGDVTANQFRAVAQIARKYDLEVRTTNRQNFVLRDVKASSLQDIYEQLKQADLHTSGAELSRDVVSCPGADTCNLAVTQSRGLAKAISDALEENGLAEVGGIRINISGCTNSCGQHHIADIGLMGAERRAHGRPAPGYQLYLGGKIGDLQVEFGTKAGRLPAKKAPEAVCEIISKYVNEKQPAESFGSWLERIGGAKALSEMVKSFDEFPEPDIAPDFYVDYDEIKPYSAEVGMGECMGA